MSPSIFGSALGRALSRRPLSSHTISRLNATISGETASVHQQPASEASEYFKHHATDLDAEPEATTLRGGQRPPKRPIRPSPLSTRQGRKIPKLLVALRDIGLAKDIPGPVRGKRNLVHTDPKTPFKRNVRRCRDNERLDRQENQVEHGKVTGLTYFEQLRRYKLESAIAEADPRVKYKVHFTRRARDESLSLSSITREYLEEVAWLTSCSFSPLHEQTEGSRVKESDIGVITKVFNYKARWFLESKGYDPCDVVVWGWILAAKDAEQAGWRMKLYQEGLPTKNKLDVEKTSIELQPNADSKMSEKQIVVSSGAESSPMSTSGSPEKQTVISNDADSPELSTSGGSHSEHSLQKGDCFPPKPFPTFLILHTIRRKPLSRTTLNYVLSLGSGLLTQLGSDKKTKIMFIIRLLRRIQEENILALPYLAQLIITHLVHTPLSTAESAQHLTFVYNQLLSLMARTSHERPFQSHPVVQQSQFMLLRKMSAMNLVITRTGYRSIISVQLARAKTQEERERIRGMKMSWPPWQEERDAWSDKLDVGRVTRAGVVLRQMQDAGYGLEEWENAAAVLAGEDTDQTPTIATRTYLSVPPLRKFAEGRRKDEGQIKPNVADVGQSTRETNRQDNPQQAQRKSSTRKPYPRSDTGEATIWRTRIRATRTLEEAWSIFLNARATFGRPTESMYHELAEKVVAAERLQKENGETNSKSAVLLPDEGTRANPQLNRPTSQSSQDKATIQLLLRLPEKLTSEQRLLVMRNHANETRLKQLLEDRYRPGKPVPGEAKEVLPAPFSPSEGGVHVPIPPPSLASLYHMMSQDGYEPTPNMLMLLVKMARNMETANELLGNRVQDIERDDKDSSSNIRMKRPNWRLLTAYLQALINSGFIQRAIRLLIITSLRKDNHTWPYLPAWNIAMKALVDWKFRPYRLSWKVARDLVESNVHKHKVWLCLVWKLYLHMRDIRIYINGDTLMSLCTAAKKVMQLEADLRVCTGNQEIEEITWDGKKPWEQVIRHFRALVGHNQSVEERKAELQALRDEAIIVKRKKLEMKEKVPEKEEKPPSPPPFWATLDEPQTILEQYMKGHETQVNIDDSLIDPAYYTPHPPPPPPPPSSPPIPEPENSAAVISRKYTPPLYIPSFAILHAYIRLLGQAGQKEEIILTLAWLAGVVRGEGNSSGISLPLKGTDEVGTTVGEKRRARSVLIAARINLEEGAGGEGEGGDGDGDGWTGVARMLVDGEDGNGNGDGNKLWGGWPGLQEVEGYKEAAVRGKVNY